MFRNWIKSHCLRSPCSHPIFGDTLIFHRKNGWLMDCKSPYAESFNLIIQQLNTILNQGINKSGKFEFTK